MKNLFIGIDFSKEKYCCPIKLFLSRAYKIRAGTYCKSQPFLVTFAFTTKQTTMGKSNHFIEQQ